MITFGKHSPKVPKAAAREEANPPRPTGMPEGAPAGPAEASSTSPGVSAETSAGLSLVSAGLGDGAPSQNASQPDPSTTPQPASPSDFRADGRPEARPVPRRAGPFPAVGAPNIVVTWLLRLRWFAIIGQLAASGVALSLGLEIPLLPVIIVVLITIVSNVILWRMEATRRIATGVILGVLLLDMALLTVLLVYSGGIDNPFSTLYLVHVAMAVTTLGGGWTWIVVVAACVGYASLFFVKVTPLTPYGPFTPGVEKLGLWTNLALTAGLITYFSSRVNRSLRRRELELLSLRDRTARHEQLATLTTLAAGAAHELGTPLATIALVARELELAILKLENSGPLVEDAQLIRQECDRCRYILDRMRVEVASDTRGVTTPIEDLLRLLYHRLRPDEQHRIRTEGPTGGFAIAASGAATEQSLTVMIRNALDASPGGQPVCLQIRTEDGFVCFSVVDQGHGMSEEVLKHAGEPFFTTKEPGRGMGLGLFLVRLVAENFNGQFNLTSEPERGTTSTLRLPLTNRPERTGE